MPVPETATSLAIEARSICRRYGRRWALVDVSFNLPKGRSLMVSGRNGSGKSTLFRVLATAIRADRGGATVAGFDIGSHPDEVRKRLALLGHYAYTYEALTARENLQIASNLGTQRKSADELMALLEEVGLAERADDVVGTFSAGMRKRLALARTLLQGSEIVLLDEPYGQLDPPGFRLIDKLFQRFKEQGVTVMLSTHQLERGAALCDDGIVLENGRVRWTGPARELPSQGGLDPAAYREDPE